MFDSESLALRRGSAYGRVSEPLHPSDLLNISEETSNPENKDLYAPAPVPEPAPTSDSHDIAEPYGDEITLHIKTGLGVSSIGSGEEFSHVEVFLQKEGVNVLPSVAGLPEFDVYFDPATKTASFMHSSLVEALKAALPKLKTG
jgi:hypothetical protein